MGQYSPGAVIQKHVLDHFAAAKERRHRLEQRLPRPKEPHPGRATKLVGGANQEVGFEGHHIDALMRQALASIHQHQGTNGMRRGDHRLQRIAASQRVADMHQTHQSSALRQLRSEIL